MRKLLLTVLAGVVVSLAFAAPAFAQLRDPFDPAIDTTADTGGESGGEVITPGGGETVDPAPQEDVGSEGLANTGIDTAPWLVAALGLIAAGGASVLISKELRTTA